jgi:hypothetical protein
LNDNLGRFVFWKRHHHTTDQQLATAPLDGTVIGAIDTRRRPTRAVKRRLALALHRRPRWRSGVCAASGERLNGLGLPGSVRVEVMDNRGVPVE